MAITTTNPTQEPRSFSKGPVKFQLVNLALISGATSGTVTASNLKEMYHILIPGIKSLTAAPTFSANVATVACTVSAETAATLVYDTSITLTAVADQGATGNSITLEVIDGSGDDVPVTAGNEIVSVSGKAISVRMDPTAVTGSTRTQVRAAINANVAAAALVTATGSSATVAAVLSSTPLAGGVSGGFYGPAICIGR
jgi:hypothetical protein